MVERPFEAAGYEHELADRAVGDGSGQQICAGMRAAEEEAGRLAELRAGEQDVTGNWRGVVGLIRAGQERGSTKVNESLVRDFFGENKEG